MQGRATTQIACKPGMEGDGIRPGRQGDRRAAAQARPAAGQGRRRLPRVRRRQADDTLPKARGVRRDAVKAGDVEAAKKAVRALARSAGSASSRSPSRSATSTRRSTLREADLEEGQNWTGWHRLEKALWADRRSHRGLNDARRPADHRPQGPGRSGSATAEITPTSMANGAKELLDEVATGKVTGEEEALLATPTWWTSRPTSRAPRRSYELLKPVVQENDAALATELDKQFAAAADAARQVPHAGRRRLRLLRHGRRRRAQGALRRGQRAGRAAVQARRRRRRSDRA